jgi:competence protein ComEA
MRTFVIGLVAAGISSTALAAVNVNTAQQSELQSTRGLDRVTAKRIIEYRNGHGSYKSLDDLAQAIGPDTTARVSEQVRFDGDPYTPPPRAARTKRGAGEPERKKG